MLRLAASALAARTGEARHVALAPLGSTQRMTAPDASLATAIRQTALATAMRRTAQITQRATVGILLLVASVAAPTAGDLRTTVPSARLHSLAQTAISAQLGTLEFPQPAPACVTSLWSAAQGQAPS